MLLNFKGQIFYKQDKGYEEARVGRVFNHRRPNRFPEVVFFPIDEDDVVKAVKFAGQNNHKIAIRAGGHSWAAWSVRDTGILIDLKHFNNFSLDKESGIVSAGPATKGGSELNPYLIEHGLFFNGGHCPTVGIGGFLLQGGQGWNARGWGWSAEQIVAIDVILASGEKVRADANNYADLFWAARGAGPGFFGVVTCFHLQTRPYPKALTASTYVYPAHVCKGVLHWLQSIHHTIALSVELVAVGQVFDFGEGIVVHGLAFEDTPEAAKLALAPLEECPYINEAIVRKMAMPTSIKEEVRVQNEKNPEGHRWAVNNAWLKGTPDEVTPLIMESFLKFTSKKSFTLWYSMAPLRQLPDMAFSLQTDIYMAMYAIWEDEKDDQTNKDWVKQQMQKIEPITAGQYTGDSDFQVHQRKFVADENWQKLQGIRAKYDTKGLFHSYLCQNEKSLNQNEF